MKKFYMIATVLALAVSLCACGHNRTAKDNEHETTVTPTTHEPTILPEVTEPHVPETTEERGTTHDTTGDHNEGAVDEGQGENNEGARLRRRIMG